MMKAVALWTILGSVSTALSFQTVLDTNSIFRNAPSTEHNKLLNGTDLKPADIQSVNSYSVLQNDLYPNHRVRIKKSDFCDPTVKYVRSRRLFAPGC